MINTYIFDGFNPIKVGRLAKPTGRYKYVNGTMHIEFDIMYEVPVKRWFRTIGARYEHRFEWHSESDIVFEEVVYYHC